MFERYYVEIFKTFYKQSGLGIDTLERIGISKKVSPNTAPRSDYQKKYRPIMVQDWNIRKSIGRYWSRIGISGKVSTDTSNVRNIRKSIADTPIIFKSIDQYSNILIELIDSIGWPTLHAVSTVHMSQYMMYGRAGLAPMFSLSPNSPICAIFLSGNMTNFRSSVLRLHTHGPRKT